MTGRGRGVTIAAAALLLGLAASILLGVRWGDRSLYPPDPGEFVVVYVVSNGFHSGLVLPRAETARVAGREGRSALIGVGQRFDGYDWIEAGWGEERFYRATPTLETLSWRLGLRALFWPGNHGILHIVGIEGDPRSFFGRADVVRVQVSPVGFDHMLARIDASFARDAAGSPVDLGAGLYGPSLFFQATGQFDFANLCNHWTARMLDAAGLPTSPLLATIPRGIVIDLGWRAGLRPEPATLPGSAASR